MQRCANRLIQEKSPYLLQHAHNPVDWFPWGTEAFETARREDKPIFLSIGYSTCHWCHVMEKESFEDDDVAKAMNDAFVNIKVDREERPDLDSIYMTACMTMTGSSGWPLNLILTPDKKPFFASTYIPKESRFGRIGILEIVPKIINIWKQNRSDVIQMAHEVVSAISDSSIPEREDLNEDTLHETYGMLLDAFDEMHGGFGDSPKFPTPHNLTFLLRYWHRTGDKMALFMVEKTLSAMRNGGIYDQIGYGFHRYSTDTGWLVPHFEKMLYDQALIAMAYIEAYQATGKEEYSITAKEIFSYVLRDMTSPEGGFYSAEDADSEGEEGKFYLWTEEEIKGAAGEESEFIKKVFNVDTGGNFGEGKSTKKNILHLKRRLDEIARKLKTPEAEFYEHLLFLRAKLLSAREKRVHPHKDDKIMTDWNGLMIAALAKGAQAFDEPYYARAAIGAADFIISKMHDKEGFLYHRYRDGENAVKGFLDDYAFFISGLIEIYEATFEVNYLKEAIDLMDYLLINFWDEDGGFYLTANDAENNLVRKKVIYDGATPSGNSVAMLNLLRLGRITADPGFEKKAELIAKHFSGTVAKMPFAFTNFMTALDFAIGPSSEVVIVGDTQGKDTRAMLHALGKAFYPDKVVIFRPAGTGSSEIVRLAGYLKNMSSREGKATAYVCQNYSCKFPTIDIEKMMELLRTIKK
ncbi:MAG: thioredoxin domain-containing protein [Candidatus Methanoperedens sp.]|nr:thioredoxin domain-containing protein [Candidatus Methanoperedens sp.]MCE8425259.1 thioredoxin domain-containing protein [Candidatus Methanoperedens sp.]MCE8427923.1 thioredoxin domain-containing protein [Candidatus Methanoperedens sp.]